MISTRLWLSLRQQAEELPEEEVGRSPPPATHEVRVLRTFTGGALKGLTTLATLRCADLASAEAMVKMILREPEVSDPIGGGGFVDTAPLIHVLGEEP